MTASYNPAQDNQLLSTYMWSSSSNKHVEDSLQCIIEDTIRCHFQDLADTYPFRVSPWGHRHALWWWLGHIATNSQQAVAEEGQLVCLLQGLVRALNFHKRPIYNFVQLHPVRPNTTSGQGYRAPSHFPIQRGGLQCS